MPGRYCAFLLNKSDLETAATELPPGLAKSTIPMVRTSAKRTPDRNEVNKRSERGLHLEIGVEPYEAENAAPSQQLSGSPAQQGELARIKPRGGGWHRRLRERHL
jgi:hypothetical protein